MKNIEYEEPELDDLDGLKSSLKYAPVYYLKNAEVCIADCGFHFTKYLDLDSAEGDVCTLSSKGDDQSDEYIRSQLQSRLSRYSGQVNLLSKWCELDGLHLLDVGSGGGLFLSLAEKKGALVEGLELSESRASFAFNEYNLKIHEKSIEEFCLIGENVERYDVVTLWDVLEHVNYPSATLSGISAVLKKGGLLLIDTPCRDSFYHRFGELSYRISRGRYPSFLNIMYSNHPYGHKQIFASHELEKLLNSKGYSVEYLKKFHELSFPIEFYLSKMIGSKTVVKIVSPIVKILIGLFPVKNKVVVVARKK